MYPSGHDNEFLFTGSRDWLLRTYCHLLLERWPGLILLQTDRERNVSQRLRPGSVPKSFVRFGSIHIFRNATMERWAQKHGSAVDRRGEAYISLLVAPHGAGTHIDIVTPGELTDPFSRWVVDCFIRAIGWWHHARRAGRKQMYCMPPGAVAIDDSGLVRFSGRGGSFGDDDGRARTSHDPSRKKMAP